jgi:chemotaxis signal transduction protein
MKTIPPALRTYPPNMPWAILQVKNQPFAIATEDLREMLIMPEVSGVPNTAGYVRGVINLRGRVIPLIDLRKRMGLPSAADETNAFCALLDQREQDHKKWLNELEASVAERRPFALTSDPHQCAFGKWYDSYRAQNQWVASLLKKFDAPHKQIHGVAVEVGKFVARQEFDGANELIARTRAGVLDEMLKLFVDLRSLVRESERETAVVINAGGRTISVSVDLALSIEKFAPDSVQPLPPAVAVSRDGVVRRGGKLNKTGEVILIIETDRLLSGDEDLEALDGPAPDSGAALLSAMQEMG